MASAVLAGCSSPNKTDSTPASDKEDSAKAAFEAEAAPIDPVGPPASWDGEADVIVVGSGGGMASAIRLAMDGYNVIMLEKDQTTGGFEMNRAMLKKYLPSSFDGFANVPCPPCNTGECIRMGIGAGADMSGYDSSHCYDGGVWWKDYDQYETRMTAHVNKDGNQAVRQPWLLLNSSGDRVPYLGTTYQPYPYAPSGSPYVFGLTDQAVVEMMQPGNRTFVCFDSKYEDLVSENYFKQGVCRVGKIIPDDDPLIDRVPEWQRDWRTGFEMMVEDGAVKKCDTVEELEEFIIYEKGSRRMGFFSPEQTSTNYLVPAKLPASRNIGGSFAHPLIKTTHTGNGASRYGYGYGYARFANGTPRRPPNAARERKGHLGTDNFGFVRSKFSAAFGNFERQKRPAFDLGCFWHYRSVCSREAKNQSAEAGNSMQNRKNLYPSQGFSHENARLRHQRTQRSSGKRLQRIEGSAAIGADGAQALAGRRRDLRLRTIGRTSRSQPPPYSAREAMLALLSAIFASMRSLSAPSAIVGW